MANKKLSVFTETEFVAWITRIIEADFAADAENDDAIYEFGEVTGHPDRWDLIFHPEPGADSSAQGIVNTVREWRTANGKPSFKSA